MKAGLELISFRVNNQLLYTEFVNKQQESTLNILVLMYTAKTAKAEALVQLEALVFFFYY